MLGPRTKLRPATRVPLAGWTGTTVTARPGVGECRRAIPAMPSVRRAGQRRHGVVSHNRALSCRQDCGRKGHRDFPCAAVTTTSRLHSLFPSGSQLPAERQDAGCCAIRADPAAGHGRAEPAPSSRTPGADREPSWIPSTDAIELGLQRSAWPLQLRYRHTSSASPRTRRTPAGLRGDHRELREPATDVLGRGLNAQLTPQEAQRAGGVNVFDGDRRRCRAFLDALSWMARTAP
jgi:hypothetical protein